MEGLSFTSAVAEALAAQFLAAADKYGRRAKTTEVIDNLDKLYKSASLYYTTPRISQVGEKLDCQFPDDAPLTPSNNCCGSYGGTDADADGRCDVQYDSWTTATWSSLMFQMVDQHYCVYSFDSNGQTGNEAAFTANAHCDLDCDGIMSTFQRYGKGEATYGECYVQSAAALFTQNETE
jgi:hypothetical protein